MDAIVRSISINALTRRKRINEETVGESQLARVLTVFDLTALGVGATLGAGVYVLTGAVAKSVTGPSVVISFLIAAITSVLSGLCYAEFGARVPKAGSGYVYSYVTVGECCAFVIGWNLILSYVIGAASVARAWTANFDALTNNTIKNFMVDCCTMEVPGLAPYPDIFSFLVVMLLTALIAFGVKEFATVNKIFTVLNIGVILFVIIAGLTKADVHNWAWTPEEIAALSAVPYDMLTTFSTPTNSSSIVSTLATELNNISQSAAHTSTCAVPNEYGLGGFLPFGFSGLISGTATCFYAFVGFDCIATTGEEAINPQKSIPLGIVFSLAVCCLAYLGISSTLTLMQPYFCLDEAAPLPHAFKYVGLEWAQYPVSVGAICALSTSLLGAMFPMPRIIYAMAVDGLLFKFLAKVHNYTKTPLIATFVSGTVAGIMAVFFDLKELVDLMSIGTLAAYTLVAASVLLLRYQPDPEADRAPIEREETTESGKLEQMAIDPNSERVSFKASMLFKPESSLPTRTTTTIVNWTSTVAALTITLFSVVAVVGSTISWNIGMTLMLILFGAIAVLCTVIIWLQPQSSKELSFEVPFVPVVPILNMFVNIYLMISLPPSTWYKMLIWMFLGALIYFFYGISHSTEGKPEVTKKSHIVRKNTDVDEQLLQESRHV
ncbi:unnamed protein product [Clavelina lepadiformis]|uniref:Cationic amino acid transporter C-terminal domain-containing protein n=1 Tax=Clavelina lepadiformis TaxID=159417 RepID=A0ABP0G118_CLALP